MTQLSALWSAQSIAVIGATERVGAMGRAPIEYLKRYGYKGEIYPVNPKGGTILGLTAYASVTEIKSNVELALIMVPAALVEESLKQCGIAGVGVVLSLIHI